MIAAPADRRLIPTREGRASLALEGLLPAQAYVAPALKRCVQPAAALRAAPDPAAEQMDQVLFGEGFEVLDEADGWAFGQARRDGYVGYVEAAALGDGPAPPTHRVSALRTYAFAEPSIKARALGPYSLNALVRVEAEEGRFLKAAGAGWMVGVSLAPIGEFARDWTTVATAFLGTPYLWGGRESLGLDCSGLVQQALYACGRGCPRDTDQQQALGLEVEAEARQRGDLVFWRGHVGLLADRDSLLHANAHHMAVALEPLAEALARIKAAGSGDPVAWRRLV